MLGAVNWATYLTSQGTRAQMISCTQGADIESLMNVYRLFCLEPSMMGTSARVTLVRISLAVISSKASAAFVTCCEVLLTPGGTPGHGT